MAGGGFVITADGKQYRAYALLANFDMHEMVVNPHFQGAVLQKGTPITNIKDWSTFSVHAITREDAKDVCGQR